MTAREPRLPLSVYAVFEYKTTVPGAIVGFCVGNLVGFLVGFVVGNFVGDLVVGFFVGPGVLRIHAQTTPIVETPHRELPLFKLFDAVVTAEPRTADATFVLCSHDPEL